MSKHDNFSVLGMLGLLALEGNMDVNTSCCEHARAEAVVDPVVLEAVHMENPFPEMAIFLGNYLFEGFCCLSDSNHDQSENQMGEETDSSKIVFDLCEVYHGVLAFGG